MHELLVVGGGVIGLLTTYQLALAGRQVALLDARGVGSEASWAGGGIVSPLYPWRYSSAVTALAHWSQDFYPELAERLLASTGIDPEVRVTGLYWFDLEDQAGALAWAAREGRSLAQVDIGDVYQVLPMLAPGFGRALHMPEVANVRNPRLVRALRQALLQMPNVSLNEHCPVTGFVLEGERVCGVRKAKGELLADQVVVAAGAWSAQLLSGLGIELSVEPVKGQMILYKCAEDFLPSMVLANSRYAIPRKDGHVLVGSTLEYAGFDKTPTVEAFASLQKSAVSMLPALSDAQLVGHWAGLRPGSPEGIPYIGAVPELPGLWLNCGHYRNGLVLAPASCELLKNLLLDEVPIVDPRPYDPAGRMQESPPV